MAQDFNASTSSIQLSLTAFLIGLASGQLIIGQLSDRFGRRTPLIVGSAICFGASVLCVLAPSIQILIGLRFVQGFAGAAGVVIARAVIADRARGRAAVQLFSTMNFTSALAPIAAPVLGGVIVTGLGWRAVFVALAVMNLCTLLGVVLFVNESLPEQRRRPSGLKRWPPVSAACSPTVTTSVTRPAPRSSRRRCSPTCLRRPSCYKTSSACHRPHIPTRSPRVLLPLPQAVPSHAAPSKPSHRVGCW